VLPYAKRAHTPEATPLRSGDFEVVRDTRLGAPRAPKAQPVFHRSAPAPLMQAQPAPRYGYAQPTHSNVVLAPDVRADVRAAAVPPAPYSVAPSSIAPVAMNAPMAPSYPRYVHHTGSGSLSTSAVGPGKPTMKWGLGILAGGALVGALLGIGLNQRDTTGAASAQMTDPEPAVVVAPATPAQAVPQNATVAQGTVAFPAGYQAQAPAPPAAAPPAAAPQPAVVATTPVPAAPGAAGYVTAAPAAAAPVNNVVIPPQQPVVVAKAPAPRPAPKTVAKHYGKRGHVTHRAPAPRVTVAAKMPAPKVEKAEKAEKVEKVEKAEAPKKRSGRNADADAILQDAIKNTTNTLGGS
jgi:hypothetical protein